MFSIQRLKSEQGNIKCATINSPYLNVTFGWDAKNLISLKLQERSIL